MIPKFIQIHTLTSYPAALLNRDDAGFAKRIPFGGVERLRISSQCLKRHWRTFSGEGSLQALNAPGSIRSRKTFEDLVKKPLLEKGFAEEIVFATVEELMSTVLGKSKKGANKKGKEEEKALELTTSQLTILGQPEIEYIKTLAGGVCSSAPSVEAAQKSVKDKAREIKENLSGLKMAAGLDAALFGRMVTSDILARGDAAVHVAHSLTVHEESCESDYFSAVDDLQNEVGELGSAHINSVELTSGLYYGYVVVDVPLLVSNLEGCKAEDWQNANRELAAKVVANLVHLIAKVSPGAKLGSTAPYSYANMVMTEAGCSQPRTFANAFLKPVKQQPDLLENSYKSLAQHICQMKAKYGETEERVLSAIGIQEPLLSINGGKEPISLNDAANWSASMVRGNA